MTLNQWESAWWWPGDRTLSEPMLVNLRLHIYVTRPQWVKEHAIPLYTGQKFLKFVYRSFRDLVLFQVGCVCGIMAIYISFSYDMGQNVHLCMTCIDAYYMPWQGLLLMRGDSDIKTWIQRLTCRRTMHGEIRLSSGRATCGRVMTLIHFIWSSTSFT